MCGAFFGHLLLNYDISMMSVFGCVALAGVVVNDAIVLIECVNSHLARGESFSDAVRLGGARRFRPIILTTISTVGGLTPLIMERDYQAQMLIPMAVALAGGVAFATLLTLLLVPCLLGILNDGRRFFRWLFTGDWPTPEEVEPATWRLVGEPDAAPVEASP
jgi:multidrug efflux pump subunit AcrB